MVKFVREETVMELQIDGGTYIIRTDYGTEVKVRDMIKLKLLDKIKITLEYSA